MNRVFTTRLAALHFAPTEGAAANLLREGVSKEAVEVTGNTGIDAVLQVRDQLEQSPGTHRFPLDPARQLIVVTAHRRESFGDAFDNICRALAHVAQRPDVQLIWPVHPNPSVQAAVDRHLRGRSNVLLLDPLPYVPFVDLLRRAAFILTDSGGIQEEAPSLGKPVLVLRDKTERPEAVTAGTARLVGSDYDRIVQECEALLDSPEERERMARVQNPYGDGKASQRIAERIRSFLIAQHVG
jgi:UDP-N-acetylglucosamine 2-epimerase (non-hydrolysing)